MLTTLASAGIASAAPSDLWVDGGDPTCSDSFTRDQASSAQTPWCSIVRAAAAAQAGDTVRIEPAVYVGAIRPAASGTVDGPVRYLATGPGVTVDAGGASAAIKLVSVTDIVLDGIVVTGAAVQGIWASSAQRITVGHVSVHGNGGPGIQLRDSASITVSDSVITGNRGAGIFETSGTTDGRYVANHIEANGIDGFPYNGDGIQLDGGGGYVADNTVVGNGDPGPYEHGIYIGSTAHDFLVEGNVLHDNAGSEIKAAGASGVVRYNRLLGGRLGMVFSDNAAPVVAYYNVMAGVYQHGVLITTDTAPARATLWNNTIVVTGRPSIVNDGSAIFVKAAASLDLRNNLVSYANADNGGSAVYLLDSRQVQSFTSNNNWFSTPDRNGRHLSWNGARITLSRWQRNGVDDKSVASAPPKLDGEARVSSTNLGKGRGQSLNLMHDIVDTPIPTGVAPDISAYQTP